MSNERSSILDLTVSLDRAVSVSFREADAPSTCLAHSNMHGLMSVSPIVCGVLSLPMLYDTAYDAFNAVCFC